MAQLQPSERKRYPTEIVVGGLSRIMAGVFGTGRPQAIGGSSSPQEVEGDTKHEGGLYHMHEGETFLPGTGNWVLDPFSETPLNTVWGHGFLRVPNTFLPFATSDSQIYSLPTVKQSGIGGLIAGQFVLQPLLDSIPSPETGA